MVTEGCSEKEPQLAPGLAGHPRLPMEKKVWWGFGVALALLAVVGLTAYTEVVKLRDNDVMVDHAHQVISSLRKVQSLVADAEAGQRGYLVTGSPLFLQPYNGASNDLDGELSTLRTLISDNSKQQESRRELERLTAKRLEQLSHVLALQESKGTSAAAQEILTLQGMRTDNAIRQIVSLMEEREDRLLGEREHAALQTSQSSRSIIVFGSLLGFGFVGVALFRIAKDFAGIRQANSALRLIEEKVGGGEARLSAIIDSAPNGVITVDEQQNIILFNPAAEQMFGFTEAEALGRPMEQFIAPRYRAAYQHHIRKFGATEIAGRKMGQREGIFGLRRNGEEFPFEASISHVEFGGKKMFTVILRDVTEERKAEEELKQQASLLDLAPVMVRDMDDRIVLWSRGAEKIYGYAKEEALGRNSHELLHTELPIPHWMIDRLLRTAGVWEGEVHHRTRDGGSVYVASQWVLYRDAHGTPIRILEVNADITAWRHAEELQTRSQKLEALGTLAGGIAHDFNNILLAINGNAQLAMADVPPDNIARQSIGEILKAGIRASDLVKRIMGFCRAQEQKKQVVKLQPVIEEALRLMRATLPARIRLETYFAADMPPAKVDPGQIHQVIVNLATNAAHAIGEKNGTIEIRLDVVQVNAEDRQAAGKLEEGKYLRLLVSDDGCGMDRATLNRIFDPFFTTKKQGEGTGLGLSVVHGIVTSHNGAIAVTSQPGAGTAFHLFFPIATEAVEEATAEAPKEAAQARSEHILYVDDEEALVFLATRLLERRGYRVSGFSDATSALKQFRENPGDFDAVVTDLSMPGMSGFELTEEIHRTRAEIPVLLTSGYLQTEDQQKAESLGIRETIQKPATADKLAGALEKILSEQPARMHATGN